MHSNFITLAIQQIYSMKSLRILMLFILSTGVLLFSDCNKDDGPSVGQYTGMIGGMGHCSLVSSDGYLYVVGERSAELLIIKTDLVGNKIWETTYDLLGDFDGNHGAQILETFDHRFVISATTTSWYYPFNPQRPGFLMKIDDNGDSLWTYRFIEGDLVYFGATAEMSDHSLMVINQEYHFGDTSWCPIGKKISSEGELLKTKIYPYTSQYEMYWWNWRLNGNGNLDFVGTGNSAGFTMEIDDSLEIVSQQVIDSTREYFNFSNTAGQYISGEMKYGWTTKLRLAMVAPVNSVIWAVDYDIPSTEWTDLNWIWPIPGGYMISGQMWFEGDKGYKMSEPYLMQIDENGNQLKFWDKNTGIQASPFDFHYIADDYYLLVGQDESIEIWRLK
jgi:hypothetical protein